MHHQNGTNQEVDAAAFLSLIHGADAEIYFQVGGQTWKNRPQTFRQAEAALRWRNAKGDDIGFVVNAGGTTAASITRINAYWIDWDCGRDEQGNYFPDQEVVRRKEEFLRAKLAPFGQQPSILVETRNGYHAYWLAAAGVTVDQFRLVQERLCVYFGSDRSVNRPCRFRITRIVTSHAAFPEHDSRPTINGYIAPRHTGKYPKPALTHDIVC